MSKNNDYPLVIFPTWYDELAEWEMCAKGFLNGVLVQTTDGVKYPVSFIDPVRLQQDMEEYAKWGTPFFSEPGLIIVDEVKPESIRAAVRGLWKQGYFHHLRPMQDEEIILLNACTDLVSLRKHEAFPTELLSRESGEWVNVPLLCQQLGMDVEGLESALYATWLADPMGNEAYAVIFFYDDESKWTMAAQYSKPRALHNISES